MSAPAERSDIERDVGVSGVELHEQGYDDFGASLEETGILTGRRSVSPSNRRQDGGWCGNLCSCCQTTSRNGRSRRGQSSCATIFPIINFVLLLVLACGGGYMYLQLEDQIKGLEKDVNGLHYYIDTRTNALERNLTALQEAERRYDAATDKTLRNYGKTLGEIANTLDDHQRQLNRLSNGTSNADVLDKLKETRAEVRSRLEREHDEVFSLVEQSKRNVTQQLQANNAQLSVTKQHVDTSLNQTVSYMQSVLGAASVDIRAVQRNVTTEMAVMTETVQTIVRNLRDKVHEAEVTIREEVDAVQKNIAQYVAVTNKQFAAENNFVKYQLAGTFTLLACLISLWHFTSHLRHYNKPDVQRRIMAVLWMVPIYSITSWLSLVWPKLEPFLAAVRDCYEAYAIYTFIGLLIAIIEDGRGLNGMIYHLSQRVVQERDAVVEYERLLAEHAPSWSFFIFGTGWSSGSREANRLPPRPVEHIIPPFPCCYRLERPTTVAAAWLYQCQLMAVQFVILRPVLTIVPLVLKHTGIVDLTAAPVLLEGYNINWFAPNLYILFVTNVSVAVAFYGLLSFYHGTEKDLEWCDPWPKFLCIKGVVFCTFWQSLTIQFLSGAGRMDDHSALQIQNLLICIEMFLAAIAHFYVFPHDEWKDGYKREKEKGIMLRDTLALRDFVKDMALMVTSWNTENEMEVLSEEKAKLTSELMNLASMSHTHRGGSGSRRDSGSHSHHASPEHSPPAPGHSSSKHGAGAGSGAAGSGSYKRRDRDRDRDVESSGGIGFQSSILNFPSFSFDLAGAEHLHRSETHSVTMSAYGGAGAGGGGGGGPPVPHPPTERTRLMSYHSQQLAVRGMRRQVSDNGPEGSATYGAIPSWRTSDTSGTHTGPSLGTGGGAGAAVRHHGSDSHDRSESLRNALLTRLQALAPEEEDGSFPGAAGTGSSPHVSHGFGGAAEGHPSLLGAAGPLHGEDAFGNEGRTGPQIDTSLPEGSDGNAARMLLEGSRSFRRPRNDSLTYSPDSSNQSMHLRSLNPAHSRSDLLGGRILFPEEGGGMDATGLTVVHEELVLEGAITVEETDDVSSLESDAEGQQGGRRAGRRLSTADGPAQRGLDRSGLLDAAAVKESLREAAIEEAGGWVGARARATLEGGEEEESPTAVPDARRASSAFQDVLTPPPPSLPPHTAPPGGPPGDRRGSSAFQDVLTPPPPSLAHAGADNRYVPPHPSSPLPAAGAGTWTDVRGTGPYEHDDDDDDQSMYAV